MEEKVAEERKAPFNEELYQRIFRNAGIPYPENEIREKLADNKAVELHNRAKEQIEEGRRIQETKLKYEIKDKRLNRLVGYYMKDETNSPENAEYNRKLVDEINTPEGAQAFANRILKMAMEQKMEDLTFSGMEDMTEKYLQDPAKYNVLFALDDLFHQSSKEKLYTIDPEIEAAMSNRIVPLTQGQNFCSAAKYMALDGWPVMASPSVQDGTVLVNLISPITNEFPEAFSTNAPYKAELIELADQTKPWGTALGEQSIWKGLQEKGLLKDGMEYQLDGKEIKLKDFTYNEFNRENKPSRLNDLQGEVSPSWERAMKKAQTLPLTADQTKKLDDYLPKMEQSQKDIWGKGSPEFRELMASVKDYRDLKESMGSAFANDNQQVMDKIREIREKADIYLGKKQGVSLNKNGKIRYDMATELKNIADGIITREETYTRQHAEPQQVQAQAEPQKAEAQPAPQQNNGNLTEQETAKFDADRKAMQERCDSLPEGPEKLVAQMALLAKDRIYQHEVSQHVYTKMPLDMKVMVFDKLMQLDAANGGTMARAMAEHDITDMNAAAQFISRQNMGKAMKNFMQDVSPYEAGNGKTRFPVGAKLQRKAFAVGDGATEMARQCAESIQRESKAAAEQKFNEALKQKQLQQKAPEVHQGGLGMGK